MNLNLRPVDWAQDTADLIGLDSSFVTEQVYRVVRDDLSFTLVEEVVTPPLHKQFPSLTEELDHLQAMRHVVVAESDGRPLGFVAAGFESWNRRAVIWGLYVCAQHRGFGIGRALVKSAEEFAVASGARCLWLETQNINYPAIQFYRNLGFRWCGLDESLFDPDGPAANEVALYFVRELSTLRKKPCASD